ncbi:MAG: hypothetical protein HGJ94_06755 [Desulfosarcina sp.]|nr:hypothetical protein [Desulfosarcina sp.]MBC2743091.1 hypothetical protein [Desulfosarcina sp.]MBC2766001.1 hypothetical protein [Desulfosarcina sp.]
MKQIENDHHSNSSPVCFRRGRIWYTKETERRVCFALTLIMLVAGILYKTGVW